MQAELTILDTEAQIAGNIRRVIADVLNHALTESVTPIKNRLGPIIEQGIRSTPEFDSINNGTLKGELGLIAPETYLSRIINKIKESVFVNVETIRLNKNTVSGGLQVGILVNDGEYAELQGVPGASYKSHGFEIPWLKWMLVSGYAVINNYQITYDLNPQQAINSRSGQAVMIEGGSWTLISSRIPPSFVGYVGNNFLSRGINSMSDSIIKVIEEEFSSRL